MSTATTTKMTAEEFFEWTGRPENDGKRLELEDGEVVEMPSPCELHGFVCWAVSMLLGNYLARRGAGYACTNDTGLIVRRDPDTVRGPDIIVFLESRTAAQMSRTACDRIPALVVEILSPSDRLKSTMRRATQYHDRGVPLVWVIDPLQELIYVHPTGEFTRVHDETEELTGNGVLPGFSCKVADLFTLPGQTAPQP